MQESVIKPNTINDLKQTKPVNKELFQPDKKSIYESPNYDYQKKKKKRLEGSKTVSVHMAVSVHVENPKESAPQRYYRQEIASTDEGVEKL